MITSLKAEFFFTLPDGGESRIDKVVITGDSKPLMVSQRLQSTVLILSAPQSRVNPTSVRQPHTEISITVSITQPRARAPRFYSSSAPTS